MRRKMNQKRRYNTTNKNKPRVRAYPRRSANETKKKEARLDLPVSDGLFYTKRPPAQTVEDRENLDVDDLTEPSVHKYLSHPNNLARMYERSDWRDDFVNEGS